MSDISGKNQVSDVQMLDVRVSQFDEHISRAALHRVGVRHVGVYQHFSANNDLLDGRSPGFLLRGLAFGLFGFGLVGLQGGHFCRLSRIKE